MNHVDSIIRSSFLSSGLENFLGMAEDKTKNKCRGEKARLEGEGQKQAGEKELRITLIITKFIHHPVPTLPTIIYKITIHEVTINEKTLSMSKALQILSHLSAPGLLQTMMGRFHQNRLGRLVDVTRS